MDTIFMNSENSKTSDPHRLLLWLLFVFTGRINKIVLSTNDDKIMESTDSIETYEYGTSKYIVRENEGIKSKNVY